ncbi:MAG: hypothetical protein Ct9H300mP21_06050 [Pseudomonadota bacterium]|nr:MAG: hypothetical protein Ct9H300mP21_06050 [Pseudomonadota bacterium]
MVIRLLDPRIQVPPSPVFPIPNDNASDVPWITAWFGTTPIKRTIPIQRKKSLGDPVWENLYLSIPIMFIFKPLNRGETYNWSVTVDNVNGENGGPFW